MPRLTGQVFPRIPASAPLAYQLEQEVYALDGLGEFNIVFEGSTQQQLQACMLKAQQREQAHSSNMMLAIVGTAAAVFLLTEVLK